MSASVPRVIPSSIISVDKRLFALCIAVRFLQGVATCIFIGATQNSSATSSDPISELALALAAFATGAGGGFALDRLLRLKVGLRFTAASALISLAVGCLMLWLKPDSEIALIAAFLLGVGVGGEFTAFGELARQALSSAVRWKGMRGWSTVYAVGISMSLISLPMQSNATALVAGVLSILCLIGLPAVRVKAAECDEVMCDEAADVRCSSWDSHSCSSVVMPGDADSRFQETEQPDGDVSDGALSLAEAGDPAVEASEGSLDEAAECCGGSRQVRPTSFRQGVATSSIGWLAVLLSVSLGLEVARGSAGIWPVIAFAAGISMGYLMLFSVAPHSGYAVALLPFLLLGTVSSVTMLFLPTSGVGFSVSLLFSGLASGGAMCGCSAIVGELFIDRSTDSTRTRVITVSLFAASAALLLFGVIQPAIQVRTMSGMALGLVFVLGLVVIRGLPNPVISNLGSSEAFDDADGELDDVMAVVNG